MKNVNFLYETYKPTSPLIGSKVGEFRIHKSQEFIEREAAFVRTFGAKTLNVIGINNPRIDDRDSYDLTA